MRRFAARELRPCRGAEGDEPPISLCLDKEKRAVHGPKRNRLCAKPAPLAPFCAKRLVAVAGAHVT